MPDGTVRLYRNAFINMFDLPFDLPIDSEQIRRRFQPAVFYECRGDWTWSKRARQS